MSENNIHADKSETSSQSQDETVRDSASMANAAKLKPNEKSTPSKKNPNTKKSATNSQQPDAKTDKPAASGMASSKSDTSITVKPVKSPSRSWPGMLALLLLIPVAAIVTYGAWVLYRQQQDLAVLLTQQNSQLSQLQDVQSLLQAKAAQADLEAERQSRQVLAQEQQALTNQLAQISKRLGRTSIAWRLAELEYLLSIANHRLTFLGDINTAMTVLETVDAGLAQMADPGLIPVRQAIADELLSLRSVAQPDISGIALQLGSMADEVARLPMIDQQRIDVTTDTPPEAKASSWRDIPRMVWENIKSLVQIRRHSQPLEPLLPAKESWYLTQNLRLKLEQARLAALRLDTALFRQSLQEADAWIAAYYDNEALPVKTARQTLDILQQAELTKDLPDISTSLRLLRDFNARQDSSTSQPLEGVAENPSP